MGGLDEHSRRLRWPDVDGDGDGGPVLNEHGDGRLTVSTVFYASASELATLTNTFAVNGAATDPTTVELVVTDPEGTATTYSAANFTHTPGSGAYSIDVPCPTAGTWQAVWTGSGAASDVEATTWEVKETELGHLYVTPARLRARVGLAANDTSYDDELHEACFASSRWVEDHCDRFFYRTAPTEVRLLEACELYEVELPDFCDLVSLTTLRTDDDGDGVFETTWSAADYQLRPVNPQAGPERRPYTEIQAVGARTFPPPTGGLLGRQERVQGTGAWGWPAVPHLVRQASRVVAAETFRLKDAPFGVASFGEMGAISVRPNPMAERMLRRYRRNAVMVG